MIFEIDDTIPFSKRHKDETIRQIIRYDSGYLKDFFIKDERICFSPKCFEEIVRLTNGHKDNWENGSGEGNVFKKLKPYSSPYLYDFGNEKLKIINDNRNKNVVF